ncbi:MAG: hypothetical protein AAF480_09010 [Actinomycetota bacterium]
MNITTIDRTTSPSKIKRRLAAAALALAALTPAVACGQEPVRTTAVEFTTAAHGVPAIGVAGPAGNSMSRATTRAIVPRPALIGFDPAVNGPGSITLLIPAIDTRSPFGAQDGPGGTSLTIPVDDVVGFDPEQGPGSNSL